MHTSARSAKYHTGNFVIVRDTGEKIFESMPIYARSGTFLRQCDEVLITTFRIGMHLLFYGKEQRRLVESRTVENLLKEQSLKVYLSAPINCCVRSSLRTIAREDFRQPRITQVYSAFYQNIHDQHGRAS
jgi:hypothetical protein